MVPLSFAPFEFAGHELLLGTGRAVYWPAEQALIVADLHLEKASWFARAGQMLPPYDTLETLAGAKALHAHQDAQIGCVPRVPLDLEIGPRKRVLHHVDCHVASPRYIEAAEGLRNALIPALNSG